MTPTTLRSLGRSGTDGPDGGLGKSASMGPVVSGWPASGLDPGSEPASEGRCSVRALDNWHADRSASPAAAAVHDFIESPEVCRCECPGSSPPEHRAPGTLLP